MARIRSGSAVPRDLVFVLDDGTCVVQWADTRVQEVLSGRLRAYTTTDDGHPVTDFELQQLKEAGRVEHYDERYVWLFALPEQQRFPHELRVQERSLNRVRGYYLNTTLPESELLRVQQALEAAGLAGHYRAVSRARMTAVVSVDAAPLLHLKYAEQVQQQLRAAAPDVFQRSVIAFIDLPAHNGQYRRSGTSELLDLSAIIMAQTDTRLTAGRRAVVVCRAAHEALDIGTLLVEMQLDTRMATTGREALGLVEDFKPHLLVMELQLADMHGWQLLAHIREISALDELLTVVIAEPGTSSDGQSFGLGVAKVGAFLTKPVSRARLRQNIWDAFRRRAR